MADVMIEDREDEENICPACGGSGRRGGYVCPDCGGSGRISGDSQIGEVEEYGPPGLGPD